jgi:hypothetical protein
MAPDNAATQPISNTQRLTGRHQLALQNDPFCHMLRQCLGVATHNVHGMHMIKPQLLSNLLTVPCAGCGLSPAVQQVM